MIKDIDISIASNGYIVSYSIEGADPASAYQYIKKLATTKEELFTTLQEIIK